jgi:hypothetical protein
MPVVNIPAGWRLALYVLSGLGSVVVAYLFAKELIGEAEGALWAGVVALINAVAAANVSNNGRVGRNERNEVGESVLYVALVVLVILVIVWLLLGLR